LDTLLLADREPVRVGEREVEGVMDFVCDGEPVRVKVLLVVSSNENVLLPLACNAVLDMLAETSRVDVPSLELADFVNEANAVCD
jgi:hypothetical protein